MSGHVIIALRGVLAMGSLVAAILFARFWRATRDRLFAAFAAAFGMLSVNWLGVALTDPRDEAAPWFYAPRLAAFVLIIVAIVDKNRAPQRAPKGTR